MSAPVILAGTHIDGVTSNTALHSYTHAGTIYPHGHRTPAPASLQALYGVALDSVGQRYGAGRAISTEAIPSAGYTTFATSPNGDLRWTAHHLADVWSIALDEAGGRLYTVGVAVNAAGALYPDSIWSGGGVTGDRTGYVTTRAYALSGGELLWSADHGFCYQASRMTICYHQGRVYTSGQGRESGDGGPDGGNLTCYDAETGDILWSDGIFPMGGYGFNAYALLADDADALYVAGIFTESGVHYSLLKYDSDGNLIASAEPLLDVESIRRPAWALAWSGAGDLIVVTAPLKYDDVYSYYKIAHRYTAALAFVESNAGDFYRSIASGGLKIDADDRVYLCGPVFTGVAQQQQPTLTCIGLTALFTTNVSNDSDWDAWPTNLTGERIDVYSLAVSEVETPPLRMGLGFAIPTWIGDLYSRPPALALSFALGLPAPLREYLGPPRPDIYRLHLTGSPDLILPLESFSVRETTDGLFLSVVIPSVTLDVLLDIEARSTGEWVLQRGVQVGTVFQLEELARATFTGIRYDAGARSASVMAEGRQAAVSGGHQKTRRLQGISYRAETATGGRRVRCAIDTYLRVGDTADLGNGETLTVASRTLAVSVAGAFMEIGE